MNLIEPVVLVSIVTGAVTGAVLCWPIHPLMGAVGAVGGVVAGVLFAPVLLFAILIPFIAVTQGPREALKQCRELFFRRPPV
jgi:multisubunit Na+/H+ antiporter MnhE subunit